MNSRKVQANQAANTMTIKELATAKAKVKALEAEVKALKAELAERIKAAAVKTTEPPLLTDADFQEVPTLNKAFAEAGKNPFNDVILP
jgi:hypothetical protein